MTCRNRVASMIAVGIVCLGFVTAAAAAERRSGRIVGINDSDRLIVVDEIGSWQLRGGVTRVTRHFVSVPLSAKIVSHIRVNVAGRFEGDFIEVALTLSDVSVGDFVTVEGRRARGRLIATSITVAEVRPGPLP